MTDYFFIASKLNGNVLDINGNNTAPNTPIINYPPKSTGNDNQLWTLVPTGPKDSAGGQSQYYIQSKLNNYVLDISGSNTAPNTPIISYPINSPASNNQIWQIIESDTEGYFYIVSLLNGYVLDVTGSNTAPTTPIISYPKNSPASNNQLWRLVSSTTQLGSKKSAFA